MLASDDPAATFRCRLDGDPVTCDVHYSLPALEPGRHFFEAAAVDAAGNADPSPIAYRWTVAAPPVTPPAPVILQATASAPAPVPFQLTYTFRHHRFTQLSANAPVLVTIKPRTSRSPSRLRNKQLATGTKVVFRAATATRTFVVRQPGDLAIIVATVIDSMEEERVPNPGFISGSHHLTFCVGGAQEDYDFHVRTLGLKSVKKTVLFDGEIPIYHLYYANRVGDASTILTAFPYRQAGWMGKRGTNQAKSINVAVPAESIGYWSDRLNNAGLAVNHTERFGIERLEFAHPCGIPYQIVGETREDRREPYGGGDVPAEHAIRGAYGTTTSVREAGPMDEFLREAFNCKQIASEGAHHQYEIEGDGHGRVLELVEEPNLAQGTWRFGEGTIHHHAFDVGTSENQLRVKDYIVGLGYTDVSDVKDRGYFFSVYLRTPGGALFELAYSTPQGFTIDEAEDELGTHMCIPPHWEDRRSEIDQLEPIDTIETVKS